MNIVKSAIGASCVIALSACQSSNMAYQRIGYGPELEYSKAKCELASMSVEQSVFAFGSPGYVLGAQLGNAIGNEIRKAEFVKRCMVLNGWKAVPVGPAQTTIAHAAPAAPSAVPMSYQPKAVQNSAYQPIPPHSSSLGGVVVRQ